MQFFINLHIVICYTVDNAWNRHFFESKSNLTEANYRNSLVKYSK